MDARMEKARQIAKTLKLRQRGDSWLVPSQSGHGAGYVVRFDGERYTCTCPDHEMRQRDCKHVLAVCITVTKEETVSTETTARVAPDGSTTVTTTTLKVKRTTYKQEWPAYNAAQTQEKATFLRLLADLTAGVPEPPQHMGRKRIPLRDMLFAAAFKVYSTFSGRRFITDLRDAQAKGYLSRAPHYNSLFRCFELRIPEQTDQSFRLKAISHFGVSDHPGGEAVRAAA